MRIVLCYPAEDRHLEMIRRAAPGAEVVPAGQERIARELPDADIYCGHAKVPVPWEAVVDRRRLKWIQSSAAGVDHCLTPPVVRSEIAVTSLSGVLADQVAEHAVALITALLRRLHDFFRAQQSRRYERLPTRDLHESCIGIVGLGGVGRRLAEVLSAFRTRVRATDWCPVDKPSHVEALWPHDRLGDLLACSDIVVLAAPLNHLTQNMIDRQSLAAMASGSILVNIARGGLVAEPDLVDALLCGHLYGAALDVCHQEPLPASSRLWEIPQVIITPHVAGQSRWRIDRTTEFFCDNLTRYLQGRPLLNVVDKGLGFPLRRAT